MVRPKPQGAWMESMQANITFVGTPLGCMTDISQRALSILKAADIIYGEHPQTTKKLFHYFGIPQKRWVLFDKDVELKRIETLISESKNNRIAIVSRAGMPGVNDPGTLLVRHLLEFGIPFDVVPGPSIVSCLIALSGSFGPFHYFGYFPKTKKDAQKQFFLATQLGGTALYLESTHRIQKTLGWLKTDTGTREATITVVHELTKVHQTVFRGKLSTLPLMGSSQLPLSNPKGEWAFALDLTAIQTISPWRMIRVADIDTLLKHPYPQRIRKFRKKYQF